MSMTMQSDLVIDTGVYSVWTLFPKQLKVFLARLLSSLIGNTWLRIQKNSFLLIEPSAWSGRDGSCYDLTAAEQDQCCRS